MTTSQSHEQEIRGVGLRVTPPRVAVLEMLETHPHVGADAVLAEVAQQLPTASPQTVYNVLNDLTRTGLVRRIEPAGSPRSTSAGSGTTTTIWYARRAGRWRTSTALPAPLRAWLPRTTPATPSRRPR